MAFDSFLKIKGIEGESKDEKHPNEIELLSWSWGESNVGSSASGGGAGAGKVSMQDFHFTMKMNKASPKLVLACATGEHIADAVLTCRKAGGKGQEYLKVTFTDLLISSYQTGGSGGGDDIPLESISFNYATIKMEYSPQKADGSLEKAITAGYDLKVNKKI
jgi:type VI secretion system secreted protein Hcp